MATALDEQLASLDAMTTGDLLDRFVELHGYRSRTRHRHYLIRKIAWRMQAKAEGDLSERARRRAAELADDAEVRVMAPKTVIHPPQTGSIVTHERAFRPGSDPDPRIPEPGSVIVREYKGRTIRVLVLPKGQGFEYDGDRFRTLTAVAKHVTGSHINGFRFFRLGGKP